MNFSEDQQEFLTWTILGLAMAALVAFVTSGGWT